MGLDELNLTFSGDPHRARGACHDAINLTPTPMVTPRSAHDI